MSDKKPTVILPVGQKGAGKTTIGNNLEGKLGISFLRVEPIYLTVIRWDLIYSL